MQSSWWLQPIHIGIFGLFKVSVSEVIKMHQHCLYGLLIFDIGKWEVKSRFICWNGTRPSKHQIIWWIDAKSEWSAATTRIHWSRLVQLVPRWYQGLSYGRSRKWRIAGLRKSHWTHSYWRWIICLGEIIWFPLLGALTDAGNFWKINMTNWRLWVRDEPACRSRDFLTQYESRKTSLNSAIIFLTFSKLKWEFLQVNIATRNNQGNLLTDKQFRMFQDCR